MSIIECPLQVGPLVLPMHEAVSIYMYFFVIDSSAIQIVHSTVSERGNTKSGF